ncbi:hypothetical protein JCM11641_005689 [Rhodosporidiobolus odoratus]
MTDAQSDRPKKSLFDLTPEQQKKATLIFLISLGTTLLVAGRSGGKLLKRAKASEGAASIPTKQATPRPPPPPKPVQQPDTTVKLPPAPPASFLHPNSLTPPKARRLLPSFVRLEPTSSLAKPPSSAYFLPNPTLTAQSTAFAAQLDRLDKLHEDGSAELPDPVEDGFNPAVYAAKAFGIATALTFSAFGVGIWGLMRYCDVDDLEGLALALSHHVTPVLDANRPTLPSWALPSHSSPDTLDDRVTPAEEEEELSYWSSIKQELDKEAEENKRERQGTWERMRRRAEGLKTGKAAA